MICTAALAVTSQHRSILCIVLPFLKDFIKSIVLTFFEHHNADTPRHMRQYVRPPSRQPHAGPHMGPRIV